MSCNTEVTYHSVDVSQQILSDLWGENYVVRFDFHIWIENFKNSKLRCCVAVTVGMPLDKYVMLKYRRHVVRSLYARLKFPLNCIASTS